PRVGPCGGKATPQGWWRPFATVSTAKSPPAEWNTCACAGGMTSAMSPAALAIAHRRMRNLIMRYLPRPSATRDAPRVAATTMRCRRCSGKVLTAHFGVTEILTFRLDAPRGMSGFGRKGEGFHENDVRCRGVG